MEANKFITTSKKNNQPFLAFVSFYSVHTPLIGRPDLVEKYKKRAAKITGPEFDNEEMVWPKNKGARTHGRLCSHG